MLYDVFIDDSEKKYIVGGNSAGEVAGKTREKYKISDTIPVYAEPIEQDNPALLLQPIAHDLHGAALRMKQAYEYAVAHNYYSAARRFSDAYKALNLAYSAVLTETDNIAQDFSLQKKIAHEKTLSRADPANRKESAS